MLAIFVCVSGFHVPFSRPLITRLHSNSVDGTEIKGSLTPVSNNILVKIREVESSTASGIYIPDSAKERPTEGVVVAAGPGKTHPDTTVFLETVVSEGDNVIYGKYDGVELKYNNANHQLIKDDDVLVKYRGASPSLNNIECVKDKVLVKMTNKEEKTASGILLSVSSKDKKGEMGVVVKVGPGRKAANGSIIPIPVAPGDGVRFRSYAGTNLKIDGEEYIVVPSADILAKWNSKV